jgi:branched-subunit amino acid transport protein
MHTIIGTPTTVYRYAALIKNLNIKRIQILQNKIKHSQICFLTSIISDNIMQRTPAVGQSFQVNVFDIKKTYGWYIEFVKFH